MSEYSEQMDAVVAAWKPYIEAVEDWQTLVKEVNPKATGCGPVYELPNPVPDRGQESFAIADMRGILVAEPHFHPNGETEIYMVLSGIGEVVVGGRVNKVRKGEVVVTPPGTTHFTVPAGNLVLAVINTPSFNPENYRPIVESDRQVGFDKEQFARMVEAAYRQRGLVTEAGRDEPGTVYEPHRHEKTFLYTVGGMLDIRLESGDVEHLLPHQEFVVGGNQLHEAVVGPEGWEYVAAWDEAEARRYEH